MVAPPRQNLQATPRQVVRLGLTGVATAGALVAVYAHPSIAVPVCPSLSIFGVYCPFCGGTRAVHALATGDLQAVVGYNALFPVLTLLALWGIVGAYGRAAGRPLLPPIPRPGVVGAGLAVVSVMYAVLRNVPAEPFVHLAP